MTLKLESLNPKFRQLVDVLLFTDKSDINISDFKSLYKENILINFKYFCDVFIRSTNIFWENNELVWSNRLFFLFSLDEKAVSKFIENFLEKRMLGFIRMNNSLHYKHNVEYIQYLELCKIKFLRKEDLSSAKKLLANMSNYCKLNNLILIIKAFMPFVFLDINEFTNFISNEIIEHPGYFDFLISLEKQNVSLNKIKMAKLAKEILIKRKLTEKNRRIFYKLINHPIILSHLKKEYKVSFKKKLIDLLKSSDYLMIEEFHLRNISNIIDLDATIANELSIIYADKLYQRAASHKKANADRLIRLLRLFPQISPKKILSYLSSKHKMSDIKYILNAFPELNSLAAFV